MNGGRFIISCWEAFECKTGAKIWCHQSLAQSALCKTRQVTTNSVQHRGGEKKRLQVIIEIWTNIRGKDSELKPVLSSSISKSFYAAVVEETTSVEDNFGNSFLQARLGNHFTNLLCYFLQTKYQTSVTNKPQQITAKAYFSLCTVQAIVILLPTCYPKISLILKKREKSNVGLDCVY